MTPPDAFIYKAHYNVRKALETTVWDQIRAESVTNQTSRICVGCLLDAVWGVTTSAVYTPIADATWGTVRAAFLGLCLAELGDSHG